MIWCCAPFKGRTPLIRAPIGFYAKVRLLKVRFEGEAAIFEIWGIYQLIANRWNFNICFHVWGSFHLVFAVRAPEKRCDCFWPIFWPENAFSPFSYTGGLPVCKNEKLNCFDIQCVVEASGFSLNHNMTLESIENYPRHTKIVQNSLGLCRK